MPESEITIWNTMLAGDKTSFIAIYSTYYSSLFRYGFSISGDKELTKDALQELFLEIWNTRSTLNKNVKDVKSYLFTWLRRKISRLTAIQLKQQFPNSFSSNADILELPYDHLLIAFQESKEKKEKLSEALNKLSKKQLEIIRLRFFYNLSYEDIAAKTSLTTRSVYNTIYEALQHLRQDVSLVF